MPKTRRFLSYALTSALLLGAAAVAAPSATAAVAPAVTPAADRTETIVTDEADWRYWRQATAPPADWKTAASGGTVRKAPFAHGRNAGIRNTTLPTIAGSQPLSTYFTKSWTQGADKPSRLTIRTWADDGIVVFINGAEVGRANISAVEPDHDTYATAAPRSAKARANLITFEVPTKLIREGENFVAAQVISNWRATANISFAATMEATYPPVPQAAAPAPSDKVPGWGAPTWRDEFDYLDPATGKPAVDPTKWNVRDRSDLGLLFDAAVVDEGQVTVDKSDVLHIRADWLDSPVSRPADQPGPRELWHKTGYLDQRELQTGDVSKAQRYGRWEIRAKVPTGPQTLGSLAAFWLRNDQSGEIDIMEAWGYDDAAVRDQKIDTAATTVHTHTSSPSENDKFFWHHSQYGGPTPVWNDFHTYAFELTPTYAAVIVDGEELIRTTPSENPTLWDERYFGTPLHMRLNLHVGPSAEYWGLPNPDDRAATQNLDFQVDHVRVWEYKG